MTRQKMRGRAGQGVNRGAGIAERVRAAHGDPDQPLVERFAQVEQFDLNHRLYYPVYAVCEEAGLPVSINVGVPGPKVRSACQHPQLLEDVLMPPGHQPQERIVFVDMSAGPHNAERQAFIENDIKLTASQGRTLGIYDLDKDASEQNDLSDDEQLAERIGERFKAFRRELRVVPVKPQ